MLLGNNILNIVLLKLSNFSKTHLILEPKLTLVHFLIFSLLTQSTIEYLYSYTSMSTVSLFNIFPCSKYKYFSSLLNMDPFQIYVFRFSFRTLSIILEMLLQTLISYGSC